MRKVGGCERSTRETHAAVQCCYAVIVKGARALCKALYDCRIAPTLGYGPKTPQSEFLGVFAARGAEMRSGALYLSACTDEGVRRILRVVPRRRPYC